jgi:hypothetical protein
MVGARKAQHHPAFRRRTVDPRRRGIPIISRKFSMGFQLAKMKSSIVTSGFWALAFMTAASMAWSVLGGEFVQGRGLCPERAPVNHALRRSPDAGSHP